MFLSGDRLSSVMEGTCGQALAILISGSETIGTTDLIGPGYWAGDAVYAVGDSDQDSVVHRRVAGSYALGAHAYQILVEEYVDISPAMVAWLCQHRGFAADYVAAATVDEALFLNLADLVERFELPALQQAFSAQFGKEWRRRYAQAGKAGEVHGKRWDLGPIEAISGWPLKAQRGCGTP